MTGPDRPDIRVLIVDDAAFMRSMVREILSGAGGYEVAGEATNGAEAVALYRKTHPDLVTMDIVMPEMSGIEATKQILEDDPRAIVITCCALGQEALAIASIEAGARDFIVKPFSPDKVLAVLEAAASGA